MTSCRYRTHDRAPTWTILVAAALQQQDDFMSVPQIVLATGANGNQVTAALTHLKACGVADAVEQDGRLWWFLTGGADKRQRVVEMRVREPEGNRTRLPKLPKP